MFGPPRLVYDFWRHVSKSLRWPHHHDGRQKEPGRVEASRGQGILIADRRNFHIWNSRFDPSLLYQLGFVSPHKTPHPHSLLALSSVPLPSSSSLSFSTPPLSVGPLPTLCLQIEDNREITQSVANSFTEALKHMSVNFRLDFWKYETLGSTKAEHRLTYRWSGFKPAGLKKIEPLIGIFMSQPGLWSKPVGQVLTKCRLTHKLTQILKNDL